MSNARHANPLELRAGLSGERCAAGAARRANKRTGGNRPLTEDLGSSNVRVAGWIEAEDARSFRLCRTLGVKLQDISCFFGSFCIPVFGWRGIR